MSLIAIIPARSGSKGLPGKNIKPFHEKPLIAYTIETALRSKCINDVFVTTDSEHIAEIALQYGAKVPYLRPAQLASDQALARDAYIHMIGHLESTLYPSNAIETFVVLQPTSPLRSAFQVEEAVAKFLTKKAPALISVKRVQHSPYWYKSKTEDGFLVNYFNDLIYPSVTNRQKYPTAYLPNGAIYIFDRKSYFLNDDVYADKVLAYEMDESSSVDIDTQEDFDFAEFLYSKKLKSRIDG
jgi:CMP-N,N'-diacetyllegionaminic acid synthase